MDRNDSNPGRVEREMDESGMQGSSSDRQRDESTPSESTDAREGGYGYDRPTDMTVSRDDMQASSRDTDQGTDRVADEGTTPSRDW